MGGNLKRKIEEGKKILELLNQYKFSPRTNQENINAFKFVLEDNNES